jgi:hypothetical protein
MGDSGNGLDHVSGGKDVNAERERNLVKQNEVLNRLLTVLLRQRGGRIEVSERDLIAVPPETFVIQDPIKNSRGNLVFRIYEEQGCPNCG